MLDRLFCDGTVTGLTDQELLERFKTCRDRSGELAFTALVLRHGPMVMNVCRRMLRDPADADDAFQAAFLVLVRRADEIRFETSLGPWLYGVSVRIARRARDRRTTRAMTELDHEVAGSLTSRPPRDCDLRMAIDEALAHLPAPFRSAIVLCYLQGLTHAEAAGQLQCPVGTVRSRLARGRTLLKAQLERSNLAPEVRRSDIVLTLMMDRAQAILSPSLTEITARTATRLAAGQALAAIVSARLAQLVVGASLTMTALKCVGAFSLVLLGGLATWCALAVAAQGPRTNFRPAPANTAVLPLGAQSLAQVSKKPDVGNTQRRSQKALAIPDDLPPVVVNVEPKLGAQDVDPATREIRVTFSKPMKDKTWSWTEGTAYATPKLEGKIHYEDDKRTCVMPVKLEPGRTYVLGINSERFRGFKDRDGRSALPYLVVFRTRGAE